MYVYACTYMGCGRACVHVGCFNMSKNAFEVCASRQRCFYNNNVLEVSVNWKNELTLSEKVGNST